jgi:hypothetical protein
VARDHRDLDRLAAELAALTPEERAGVLAAASRRTRDARQTAAAYRAVPPAAEEFTSDEEPLAWEADGWDEFDASR